MASKSTTSAGAAGSASHAETSPASSNPIDIAMEAEVADVAANSPARLLLIDQRRLVGWQILSERAGFALKVLTGVAGVAVAAMIAAMIWSASRADGLVIKPFSVPPELAARGVTGEALASQLLDQLSRMSETSRGSMALRRVSADWGDNVSIEIPKTGVSISQLEQWLRERLGRQVRVTGEIMSQPDGSLKLVARVGAEPLPEQSGAAGDAEALVARDAEAIYRREQPISYAQFLERSGRLDDALEVERATMQSHDRVARAMAWSLYGANIGRLQGPAARAAAYRHSRAIDITASPGATGNLGGYELGLGHAELGYRLNLEEIWANARNRSRSAEAKRVGDLVSRARLASLLGDANTWFRFQTALAETDGVGMSTNTTPTGLRLSVASPLRAMHQLSDAEAVLDEYRVTTGKEPPARSLAAQAAAAENWTAAAAACDAAEAAALQSPAPGPPPVASTVVCAVDRARAGHLPEAEGAIAATPLDCQQCVLARAQIAELKGQPQLADHWFGEAVRMAPSLPDANYEWGKALIARGQPDAAIVQLREALRRSPRHADAMEAWGEALLAKGDAAGAAVKFDTAAKLTPRWGRLHLKWGEALTKQGKTDEARAQWRAAAAMDLTTSERAELQTQGHNRPA